MPLKVTVAALQTAQSNDFQMRLRTVMGMARTSVSSELRKSKAIELYEAAVRPFTQPTGERTAPPKVLPAYSLQCSGSLVQPKHPNGCFES